MTTPTTVSGPPLWDARRVPLARGQRVARVAELPVAHHHTMTWIGPEGRAA